MKGKKISTKGHQGEKSYPLRGRKDQEEPPEKQHFSRSARCGSAKPRPAGSASATPPQGGSDRPWERGRPARILSRPTLPPPPAPPGQGANREHPLHHKPETWMTPCKGFSLRSLATPPHGLLTAFLSGAAFSSALRPGSANGPGHPAFPGAYVESPLRRLGARRKSGRP